VPAPAPAPEPVAVASDPSEATTIYVAQEPSPAPAVSAAADGRAARPGDRAHVVLAGESLWSIARDVLGDGASVAKIAREVNRLWELNSDRIGTGDPDLLMVGTRLTLR
jgi:nucleoid-associated protein YgaU